MLDDGGARHCAPVPHVQHLRDYLDVTVASFDRRHRFLDPADCVPFWP